MWNILILVEVWGKQSKKGFWKKIELFLHLEELLGHGNLSIYADPPISDDEALFRDGTSLGEVLQPQKVKNKGNVHSVMKLLQFQSDFDFLTFYV